MRYDWIQPDAQTWDDSDPPQHLDDGELSTSAALLYDIGNGVVPYLSYSESFFQETPAPTGAATRSSRPAASSTRRA